VNKEEAKEILGRELAEYRRRSYGGLLSLLDGCETFERRGPSGVTYQIEVQVFFDDEEGLNLRVTGAIDDGGWRSTMSPLCDDFIMAPDGSFVGE
jgi:hypothetical protein